MRSGEPEFANPQYREIFLRALPYLQTRHNVVHVRCCYAFALELLAEEGGDPDVVIPAILLHDVGWSRIPEERQLSAFGPRATRPDLTRLHEIEGASIAGEILRDLGHFREREEEIVAIISGHDTRLESLGRNDSLVKDADKLFRISRQGFPIDCHRFKVDPSAHLAWLERRIESWFFTSSGKNLARREAGGRAEELGGARRPAKDPRDPAEPECREGLQGRA